MSRMNVGFLHPGQMGISLAATARNSGHPAHWVSQGRSAETHARAAEHELIDAGSLRRMAEICQVIVSVCPPHAAEEVAHQVLDSGYQNLYLDANAISPERVERIGRSLTAGGINFIDGGIIGGPAWEPNRTWLYLSGPAAEQVTACFSAGPLETSVIGERIGKASALKACYAAYTKGTSALLSAILATAETLGVRSELETQWSRGGSDFAVETRSRVRRVTAKAWRFVGEMDEISATFAAAGLPGEFHAAAAEIYRRTAHFKGAAETPPLKAVLEALCRPAPDGGEN